MNILIFTKTRITSLILVLDIRIWHRRMNPKLQICPITASLLLLYVNIKPFNNKNRQFPLLVHSSLVCVFLLFTFCVFAE